MHVNTHHARNTTNAPANLSCTSTTDTCLPPPLQPQLPPPPSPASFFSQGDVFTVSSSGIRGKFKKWVDMMWPPVPTTRDKQLAAKKLRRHWPGALWFHYTPGAGNNWMNDYPVAILLNFREWGWRGAHSIILAWAKWALVPSLQTVILSIAITLITNWCI